MQPTALTLVAIVYWLALAAWFGATLFVVVASPIIHRAVEKADPTLPTVLSVNLDGAHAALLGGDIVGDLLRRLWTFELYATIAMAVAQVGEWVITLQGGGDVLLPAVRTALLIAAGLVAAYGARVLRPRAESHRERYVEVADDPEAAEEAAASFNRDQVEVSSLLLVELFALAGLVFFAAIGLGVAAGRTIVLG